MSFSKRLANDKVFFGDRKKNGIGPHPPLRTFNEMADEFGLKIGQLRYHMANSEHSPPQPKIRSHSSLSVTNNYYNPSEMRAWWKLHKSSVKPR
jgi:hypothetical protein